MVTNLSERIAAFRADRPDEWSMDEFKRGAEALERRIKELEQERDDFKETARQYTELASNGVYYSIDELKRFILEQRAKGIEDFVVKTTYPNVVDGHSSELLVGYESATNDALRYSKELRKQAEDL